MYRAVTPVILRINVTTPYGHTFRSPFEVMLNHDFPDLLRPRILHGMCDYLHIGCICLFCLEWLLLHEQY